MDGRRDADLLAADIPLGAVRTHARVPHERHASSSVGSGARSRVSGSRVSTTSRRGRLAQIPEPSGTNMDRVSSWLTESQKVAPKAPSNVRTYRRPMAPPPPVLDDGASAASSRRASSTHGRDSRSERIMNWREANAQEVPTREAIVREANVLRKSSSWRSEAPVRDAATTAPVSAPRRLPSDAPVSATATPLRNVLRYLGAENLARSTVPLSLAAVFLVRTLVALGGWSGRGVPPMYGDFEAQRHWIELTLHLPPERWYRYDLGYWGLDYPPLTGWVSLLCGYVAQRFPSLRDGFALRTSRGTEAPGVVLFLRLSVLLLNLLVYTPAVSLFLARRLAGRSERARHIALLTVLLQPALILVDDGHFQYNGVMLGLAAASFALLLSQLPNLHADRTTEGAPVALQRMLLDALSRQISSAYVGAAVLFSLSLCFKQMALYFAPAVFAVMLGRCFGVAQVAPMRGVVLFSALAVATSATFLAVFLPWLRIDELGQVVHRIFPLARGVFEDKVASVWCWLSVLPLGLKLPQLLSITALARLSLCVTLAAILPGCLLLFRAAVESARLEAVVDDTQAEQVVAKVRRRTGSAAGSTHSGATAPLLGARSVRDVPVARSVRSLRETYATPSLRSLRDVTAPVAQPFMPPPRSLRGDAASARGDAPVEHGSSHGSESTTLLAGSTGRPVRRWRPASATASPAAAILPYTLVATSLAFFLFGFQTHEKSILLPLLPITLLMTTKDDRVAGGGAASDWAWAALANNVGMFSMWPLLVRDGQVLATLVLTAVWNFLIGHNPFAHIKTPAALLSAGIHAAMLGVLALQGLLALWTPPLVTALLTRFPDFFPVLHVLLATPALVCVWLWSLRKHFEIGLANGFIGMPRRVRL